MAEPDDALPLRERLKEETKQIILDALAACLRESEIDRVTYTDIANKAGVGERTVYRHFPTRQELLRALYTRLSRQTEFSATLPAEEGDLTSRLVDYFTGFDAVADVMRAAIITPQGHEMRLAANKQRRASFLKALEQASGGLGPKDRLLVAAAVQHMHSASAWLAMRENWGLTGEEAAKACTWAINAMLDDLRRRGAGPL